MWGLDSPARHQELPVETYRVHLDASSRTLRWLGDRIRRHRHALGGTGHRLSAGRQAVLALAWLRTNHTFAELAGDFGVGLATAWRYAHQVLRLPASPAPALATALTR